MRKPLGTSFVSAAVACLACLTDPLQVRAQGQGPYLQIDGGASLVQELENNTLAGFPATLRLNPGFRLGVQPGYTIYASQVFDLGAQFETGFIYNSFDNFTGNGFTLSGQGEMYQIPFLVEIAARLPISSRFIAYLGVGGGGVYSHLALDALAGTPIGNTHGQTDPALQAMGGLAYKFNEHHELGLSYKFLATYPAEPDYIGTHTFSILYVVHF